MVNIDRMYAIRSHVCGVVIAAHVHQSPVSKPRSFSRLELTVTVREKKTCTRSHGSSRPLNSNHLRDVGRRAATSAAASNDTSR